MGLLKAGSRSADTPADTARPASLADPDPALRRQAVQALVGVPEGPRRLAVLLQDEADASVRQAAFLALAAIGTRAAAEAAAGLLAHPDPALRNGALETLAAMPDHAAALLDSLGADTDPDIRSFAVLLAADLAAPEAAAWLVALAEREGDGNVCAHIAEALGGSIAPGARAALSAIAARFPGEPQLQFAIDIALRRLDDA
jgi:HEAT repeat protein